MEQARPMMSSESGPPPEWWRSAWVPVAILSLAVWLTFARTAGNELVFDDLGVIRENAAIENIENVRILFSKKDYFRSSDEYSYRPVVTLSYFLDHAIAGKKSWVYHVHNVLLHHINVLLAFALFVLLGAGRWRAFAIAMVFALHPLQIEAVIFPGFREDLQMTLGMLAASCVLAADRRQPTPGWILLAGALAYAFALFAKEAALLLPLVWLVCDVIHNRNSQRPVALGPRYIPLAVVAVAYVIVRFFVMTNPDAAAMDITDNLPLKQRIATAPYLFTYYVRRFFWPGPLCIIHDIQPLSGMGGAFNSSVVIIVVLAAVWVALAWRESWLLLPGFWIAATFAPVCNLYEIANYWAERFYYSVSLGSAAIAVVAVGTVWQFGCRGMDESRRRKLPVVGWIAFGILAWVAALYDIARISTCSTPLKLWRATVRTIPENGYALITLANAELEAGNYDEVVILAQKAESREGGGAYRANAILGRAAFKQKKWREAIAYLEKAVLITPPSIAHQTMLACYLADAHVQTGSRERAIAILREAQKQDPRSSAVRERLRRLGALSDDAPTTPVRAADQPSTPSIEIRNP